MNRYANQGKSWEDALDAAFSRMGPKCTVVRQTAPVKVLSKIVKGRFSACFATKGTCDFEGGFHGMVVSLDAKDTSKDLFMTDAVRSHQWERIGDTWAQGGISGLLLRFRHENDASQDRIYLAGYGALLGALDGRKRFRPEDLGGQDGAIPLRYVYDGDLHVDWMALSSALRTLWEMQRSRWC